ncbi:MAG: hypothetical protein D6681_20210 [Calditrichaeota bacterium]|nr:MAG: hypothetical protein D6681_20210 [Calditrichota bacterium]
MCGFDYTSFLLEHLTDVLDTIPETDRIELPPEIPDSVRVYGAYPVTIFGSPEFFLEREPVGMALGTCGIRYVRDEGFGAPGADILLIGRDEDAG